MAWEVREMTRNFYWCILAVAVFSAVFGWAICRAHAEDEPGPEIVRYGTPARPVVMPEKTDGVFRGFIWGVSKDDVRTYETAAFYKEEPNALFFIERPSEEDFSRVIRYDFQDGKLWRVEYSFQELNDPDASVIMNIHEDFKNALKLQYGAPKSEDMLWGNTPYRNHPQLWPRAMLSKALRMKTLWETEGTRVTLENYFIDPDFKLSYIVEDIRVADVVDHTVDVVPAPRTSPPSGNGP